MQLYCVYGGVQNLCAGFLSDGDLNALLAISVNVNCYTFLDKLHKKVILALYYMLADIAQLVEYKLPKLPKLGVAGSNPLSAPYGDVTIFMIMMKVVCHN